MLLTMLRCKLHGAEVTRCDPHYEGSVSIDAGLLEAAGLLPFEQVDVLNITNGERFTTYVIEAPAGSGEIGINGAAARKALVGDRVIILAYGQLEQGKASGHAPVVVLMKEGNKIDKIL